MLVYLLKEFEKKTLVRFHNAKHIIQNYEKNGIFICKKFQILTKLLQGQIKLNKSILSSKTTLIDYNELIPFFLATLFVLCYLGWKFEKEGQKNEMIGWRNPKMQEWENQETIALEWVGWEVHGQMECDLNALW